MLNNFFSPKSIAVIGASHNKEKLGFLVYENIRKYGFKGKLYGVNIKGGKIGTQKLYKSVNEITGDVDLAVIVVPAIVVPSVIEECGKKGINSVIIISAGFAETGANGRRLEEQIKETAHKYSIRVLGPNCLGIIDSWSKMNASFAESMPDKMNISLFSQSGAICTAILDWANANCIGFSRFISLGNKLDVDENDILRFLAEDEKTGVVLGYLESIHDGTVFMSAAKNLSLKKPFIVVKSGTTAQGAKSISSHTGSIAGSDLVTDAALKESGVIRAGSLEDLFDLAKIFAFSPDMKGKGIAVISNAGGPAVMLADAISKSRLKLARLSDRTRKVLEETLPPEASVHNPIDVIGDARADRYETALDEVLKDENVDGVIVVLTPQVMTEIEVTAKLIAGMKERGKPIAVCFMGGEKVALGREILEEKEIPSYDFPERAVKALEALHEYYEFKSHATGTQGTSRRVQFNKNKAGKIIQKAFSINTQYITDGEESAFDVFDAYGIETVKRSYGVNFDELKEKSDHVGFPLAVKTCAKGVLHKTDIGGVKIGVRNDAELQKAYFSIRDNVRRAGYEEGSDRVDVYKMENDGVEIFLGAKKDANFGPLIIFGMGGIFVEALKDFSYRIAPVTHAEAKKMISEIKSQKVLNGFRGMPEVNRDKLADAIVGLSWLMLDFPEIKEIDINPLKCTDKKCVAVDGKIILDLQSSHVLELIK
ncbi:MAG: acetate--CoA ligase family protein [bacterium]|nr:acetate--CoA ligase family protein [bacterium]